MEFSNTSVATYQKRDVSMKIKNLKNAELPYAIMQHFDQCVNIPEDLAQEINEKIDKLLDLGSPNKEDLSPCMEMLGVYLAPQIPLSENGNIIICPECIEKAIQGCSQANQSSNYELLYLAVETHEYAHALMCPRLDKYELYDKLNAKATYYTLLEESLANAYMLFVMKKNPDFTFLKAFVNKQPVQYRLGLVLYEKFNFAAIKKYMHTWKHAKRASGWEWLAKKIIECFLDAKVNKCKTMLANYEELSEVFDFFNIPLEAKIKFLESDEPLADKQKKIKALKLIYKD